ncbi:hypothetical protein AVEN_167307-1 [Araneus ventricosus]|uniref:Uncharacterized protein n=1 Tax=Araneus ventricosus TaxID=182803 RepID=A0A4Y2DBQ9_ARAVE|nr:hypothetical protein AVEN_167307-1 [Araneus ventricosus]
MRNMQLIASFVELRIKSSFSKRGLFWNRTRNLNPVQSSRTTPEAALTSLKFHTTPLRGGHWAHEAGINLHQTHLHGKSRETGLRTWNLPLGHRVAELCHRWLSSTPVAHPTSGYQVSV